MGPTFEEINRADQEFLRKARRVANLNSNPEHVVRRDSDGDVIFWCQPCELIHVASTQGNVQWTFNGDHIRPTLEPSVRVRGGPNMEETCHFYVRDGRIEYLGDCTHALAGKTVDMLPWPQWPSFRNAGDPT